MHSQLQHSKYKDKFYIFKNLQSMLNWSQTALKNLLGHAQTRYHQISAIFQALLLNFPVSSIFFSQEVVQYLSNDLLVSFMGISPFLSLIYHTQNTINTEIFSVSHHKSGGSVARFSSAARAGGVQFPAWVVKAFICLISQQQTSVEKFHRYLYIKYICDVIIQYLGD